MKLKTATQLVIIGWGLWTLLHIYNFIEPYFMFPGFILKNFIKGLIPVFAFITVEVFFITLYKRQK